jgi:hypothetical protein
MEEHIIPLEILTKNNSNMNNDLIKEKIIEPISNINIPLEIINTNTKVPNNSPMSISNISHTSVPIKSKIIYNPTMLDKIVKCIKINIKTKNIDINSAFDLIICSMEIMETYDNLTGEQKKQYILLAIEQIANGDDGISNTSDDYISKNIVNTLKKLLEEDILNNFIDIISNASKNKFDINKIQIKTNKCCKCFCL